MTSHSHDLIILGGGPAGLSASIYATRAGLDALTIEQGAFGGQISTTDAIDNYPGIEDVSGAELGERMRAHAENLGGIFAYDTIEAIEKVPQGFLLRGYDGEYASRALIYAAGASPRPAGFEGEEKFRGRGVSYCATCDGMFYRGKRIFVVGGGNTACEEALFLARFASEVTLVVRKDHLRAVKSLANRVATSDKITVRYQTSIAKIEGEDLPQSISFRNNESGAESIETFEPGSFGIFVSVGREPQTALVKDLVDLMEDGSVATDADTRTKTPGLFCAGDVRHKTLRQVITAASDGAIAATEAASYLTRLRG